MFWTLRAQGKYNIVSRMWGRGLERERERSVSHSDAELQAEGGMGPGTANFCVEAKNVSSIDFCPSMTVCLCGS